MEDLREISIPFEEYKELLIIKGKYEELKSQTEQPIIWRETTTPGIPAEPYKITL